MVPVGPMECVCVCDNDGDGVWWVVFCRRCMVILSNNRMRGDTLQEERDFARSPLIGED